jgi:hypothetical protein
MTCVTLASFIFVSSRNLCVVIPRRAVRKVSRSDLSSVDVFVSSWTSHENKKKRIEVLMSRHTHLVTIRTNSVVFVQSKQASKAYTYIVFSLLSFPTPILAFPFSKSAKARIAKRRWISTPIDQAKDAGLTQFTSFAKAPGWTRDRERKLLAESLRMDTGLGKTPRYAVCVQVRYWEGCGGKKRNLLLPKHWEVLCENTPLWDQERMQTFFSR